MKRLAHLGGLLALGLLFVGAGCTQSSTLNITGSQDGGDSMEQTDTKEQTTTGDRAIVLTGTVLEDGNVSFSWELNKALTEPEKFILVRGLEKNPSHDGKTDWYRHPGHRRTATWEDVPAGDHHFRICSSPDGETCDVYSNDVMITVGESDAMMNLDIDVL